MWHTFLHIEREPLKVQPKKSTILLIQLHIIISVHLTNKGVKFFDIIRKKSYYVTGELEGPLEVKFAGTSEDKIQGFEKRIVLQVKIQAYNF